MTLPVGPSRCYCSESAGNGNRQSDDHAHHPASSSSWPPILRSASRVKQLPPHKFSRQIKDGPRLLRLSRPDRVRLLYVGDQNAYATYRKNVSSRTSPTSSR